jgi:rod shape-determining protein MreC
MKLSIKTKIGLIVFLLIVFFIVLNLINFSKDIKNFFYLISAPIQGIFWQTGEKVSDFFGVIFNIKELKEENEDFKLEIQKLNAKIIRLKEIEKENRILREALDIGLQKEFKKVLAQITGKNVAYDSIVINKGTRDGILKNMSVITQQKILIGRVSHIYDNFSKVMLVSNKNSVVPVKIQETEATAVGKTNLQIGLDKIPLESEIKDGDKVVTSGLGDFFPSGILMGYVRNIEKSGIDFFQQAEIQPAVNLREIRSVFVIIDF